MPFCKQSVVGTNAAERLSQNAAFPLEVRSSLSQWIEGQPWDRLDPNDPQFKDDLSNLVNSLVHEVRTKCMTETNLALQKKLKDAADYFERNHVNDPFSLVQMMRDCLQTEKDDCQPPQAVSSISISEIEMNKMRMESEKNEAELVQMEEKKEKLVLIHESLSINQGIIQQRMATNGVNDLNLKTCTKKSNMFEHYFSQTASAAVAHLMTMIERTKVVLGVYQQSQERVLNDILGWKRRQQLSSIGYDLDISLDRIQQQCEALADVILKTYDQLNRIETFFSRMPESFQLLPNLWEALTTLKTLTISLLSVLIQNTFLVEKQPLQVLKVNTRFSATARLLIGSRLNVFMKRPEVTVKMINELQASSLMLSNEAIQGSMGVIGNNAGNLGLEANSKGYNVCFKNMRLTEFPKFEKKPCGEKTSVMDTKCCLYFETNDEMGVEGYLKVWTTSLPTVVIRHGNQVQAWATVLYDDAFAQPNRSPFQVPEKVPWSRMSQVLSMNYKHSSGRALDTNCLRYLAEKIFGFHEKYNDLEISRDQFCKQLLPGRTFTFWMWFHQILVLTKEDSFHKLTSRGAVLGFVSRSDTEKVLSQQPAGTFLLRYSDSILGGVTIAWVIKTQSGEPIVQMVEPLTEKDFAQKTLSDSIKDLSNLVYLYPNQRKDDVFGKFYTQASPPSSLTTFDFKRYVKTLLKFCVEGEMLTNLDQNTRQPQEPVFKRKSDHSSPSASGQTNGSKLTTSVCFCSYYSAQKMSHILSTLTRSTKWIARKKVSALRRHLIARD